MTKVARNQSRDQDVWRRLEAHGWAVVIVWECELDKAHFIDTVDRVAEEIVHYGEADMEAKDSRHTARTEYLLSRRALTARTAAHLAELKNK